MIPPARARFVVAGLLAALLPLLGLLITTGLFRNALRHGSRVEATRSILLESMGLQREAIEGMEPSRYLIAQAELAMERMWMAVSVWQTPDQTLHGELHWMRRQITAIDDIRQRLHAADDRRHRDFLRALLSLQLHELTESAEILHRTAVHLRNRALVQLYVIGTGILVFAVLCVVAILVQYLRNQRLRDLHTRQLDEANRRLRNHAEELESYLYISSHDLKEPLRSITAFGELLQQDLEQQRHTSSADYIAIIRSNAQRMRELIDGLMQLARLDRGSYTPELLSSRQEVEAITAGLAGQLEAVGGSITLEDLPELRVDRLRFRLVLQQLIANAIRYRDPDRPLQIRIGAEREAGAWRFEVADTGIGIHASQHLEIFRLFRRLHQEEVPGIGVGLALCRKIVGQWGGEIRVDSSPGAGSTFRFSVPDVE